MRIRSRIEVTKGILEPEEFDRILKSLDGSLEELIKVHCCDGTAWEFRIYDEKGRLVHYRPLGYIDEKGPYGPIVKVLSQYEYPW